MVSNMGKGMFNDHGSIGTFHGKALAVSILFMMVAAGFLIMAPGEVKADTQPGGTLINDFSAHARSNTWWRLSDPEFLQFKIPTEDDAYTAVCIQNRLAGEDYDLFVYSDYEMTKKIGSSTMGSDEYDIVVIDGHTYGGGFKYAKVFRFAGTSWNSGIRIESDYHNDADDLYNGGDPDYDGPLEVGRYQYSEFEYHSSGYSGSLEEEYPMINMYDIYLDAGGSYDFDITSVPGNTILNSYLFKGSGNMDDVLAQDDSTGTGDSLSFSYEPDSSGWYGFLVLDENRASSTSNNYTMLISSEFDMSATPTSKLIAPGMNVSYKVDVESLGITKPIGLSYSWWGGSSNISAPSGGSAALSTSSVTIGGVGTKSAYLNVSTTASMAAGTYKLRVWGSDTGHGASDNTDYTEVTLVVSNAPDFFLSSTPDLNQTNPGGSAKYVISMDTINNFNDDVNLSATSTPVSTGLTFSFNPSQINASVSGSVLTVSAAKTISPGVYSLSIKGTNGTIDRYANGSQLRIYDPIEMELIGPTKGEIVSGIYTFKVKAGTPTTVKDVDIAFGGAMASLGTLKMYYNSQNGFWERQVNTYSFNDGACSINITARELGGGVTYYPIFNFTLSNSAPNPVINYPMDMSYVTGSYMGISVNTSSHVINARFRIDNNAWTSMVRSGNTWTGSWDTTQITDGRHSLTIEAKDSAGLTGESSLTIFVDNNNPTCNINSPIDGQYLGGDHTFRVVATDTVMVDHVNVTVFESTITIPYNPITSSYEYTVSTTTRADGMYSVLATAYDKVGLTRASTLISFNIDNNEPSLSINTPRDGEIIGGTYSIGATSSDLFLHKVEYRIDSGGWANMTGADPTWSIPVDTTLLQDGGHILSVRSTDKASHVTEQSVDFIVDNTDPVCNIVSPFDGRFIEGVYNFQVSASDFVGIDRVMLNVFSGSAQTTLNRQTGYYEYSYNTMIMADGAYNITASAYDLSGKLTNTTLISFKVDNIQPELTINEIQTGDYVEGKVDLNVTAQDTFLLDLRYSVDGGTWMPIGTTWDTTLLLDGAHTLNIMARDQAGHSSTQSLSLIVDNSVPVCAVNSPSPSEYIEGAYDFRMSAFDPVGIESVYLNVFGNRFLAIYSASSGYYEFTTDTSLIADGYHNCTATVTDLSGKVNISIPITFQVDNNAPVLRVVDPLPGDFIEGMFTVSVNSTDVFLNRTEYNIDGTGWVDVSVVLNTSIFGDGSHTLFLRAIDEAGHTTTTSMAVVIDNYDPVGAISYPAIDGYITQSTPMFQVVASDLVGVEKVEIDITFDGFDGPLSMSYNSGTGYWEFRTDVSLIPDGSYNVSVVVTDLSGKYIDLGPRTFNIDLHRPEVVVSNLANGDILSELAQLNIFSRDAFLKTIQYKVDENEPSLLSYSMEGDWANATFLWDTTSFSDGMHHITMIATDEAGWTTEVHFDIYVDNENPTCTITSPVEGEFVEGVLSIRVTAFDIVGIDYVMIKVYDLEARVPYNAQTGYYEYSSNTITWGAGEDGIRNVTAIAYDLTGKSYTYGPIDFNVDNRAPSISINSPLEGEVVSGTFMFDVYNGDVFAKATEYNIDGASWQAVTLGWDTTRVADGEHRILIRATDLAGHMTMETINVIVDNHDPEVEIASPSRDEYVEGVYTFKVIAFDQVGIERAVIDVAGRLTPISYNIQTGYYEFVMDTRGLDDGTHTVNATVTDVAGRSVTTSTIEFRVDNSFPSLTVETPVKGELISGLYAVRAYTGDVFPGAVRYAIDGTTWYDVSVPWDSTLVGDGPHQVTIRTTDKAGHSMYFDVDVTVDNSPPVISQATIAPGQIFSGVQTLRFYVVDAIGVRQVTLTIDDENAIEIFKGESGMYYEYLMNTRRFQDGNHVIHISVTDMAGNEVNDTYGIKTDNTGPEISLDYFWIEGDMEVRIGEVKEGTSVVFKATVTDPSNVSVVYINIDSSGWREMTPDSNASNEDTYLLYWPTVGEDTGAHIFQIKTSDILGNENSKSGLINVRREIKEDSFGERFVEGFTSALPILWFLIFVALMVALFILGYLGILTKWARGEGREREEKPTEGKEGEEKPKGGLGMFKGRSARKDKEPKINTLKDTKSKPIKLPGMKGSEDTTDLEEMEFD